MSDNEKDIENTEKNIDNADNAETKNAKTADGAAVDSIKDDAANAANEVGAVSDDGEGDLFETIVPRRSQVNAQAQRANQPQQPRPQPMPQRPEKERPRPQPMPQRPGQPVPQPRRMPQGPERKPQPRPRQLDDADTQPRTQTLKRRDGVGEPRLPELKRLPQRQVGERRDIDDVQVKPKKAKRAHSRAYTFAMRALLVFVTVIIVALVGVISLVRTIVTGPSETVRDMLVVSAMQASATKWLPKLFLDGKLVDEIIAKSQDVQQFTEPMTPYVPPVSTDTMPSDTDGDGGGAQDAPVVDEWANAVDGMIYKTMSLSNFKAYILIVRDASRIYVGTSSDYKSGKIGSRIFDIVEREGAVAAINAGEFADTGGTGTGDNPIGLTYSKGSCVWDDGTRRTFIGFDEDGVLHAIESIKKSEADALGIRDAVSFQTGNVLISNDGESVTYNYSEGNVGRSQRTAIAQRADGAVILLVTDGRTASSLGATRNEIIDLLKSEGAVVAGMLDGGSSTMMYYEDYYTKYNIDTSDFDEYQLMGLTNKYKAFTKPRHLPTFFLVRPES